MINNKKNKLLQVIALGYMICCNSLMSKAAGQIFIDILNSIKNKKYEELKTFIEEEPRYFNMRNTEDISGLTPLHLAVTEGDAIMVDMIIKDGHIDSNIKDLRERTPLHLAAKRGDIEIIRTLISLGARIDEKDTIGRNPLHYSAECEKIKAITDIKSEEFIPTREIINAYDSYDSNHIVKINYKSKGDYIREEDDLGMTPIHIGALCGNNGFIKLLEEEYRIDINLRNRKNKLTPILLAAKSGELETVKLLYSLGANYKLRDEFRLGILHYAAFSKNVEVVRFSLYNLKMDPNVKSTQNITPIFFATFFGNSKSIIELMKAGANPNIVAKSYILEDDNNPNAIINRSKQFTILKLASSMVTDKEYNNTEEDYYIRVPINNLRTFLKFGKPRIDNSILNNLEKIHNMNSKFENIPEYNIDFENKLKNYIESDYIF